jgi:hypothetical protein
MMIEEGYPTPKYQVQTQDPGGRDLWQTVASFAKRERADEYVRDIAIVMHGIDPPRLRIREYSSGRVRIVWRGGHDD